MKKRYIIVIHLCVFIFLFIISLVTSETLLNLLMPGFSNVNDWILLISVETMLLLILVGTSCTIFMVKQKKNKNI